MQIHDDQESRSFNKFHLDYKSKNYRVVTRVNEMKIELKYGCNPNQKPASVYMEDGSELPF